MEKAKEFNLNLENFEGKGLEEQAVQQLNDMMNNKKRDGFLSIIKPLNDNNAIKSLISKVFLPTLK